MYFFQPIHKKFLNGAIIRAKQNKPNFHVALIIRAN